MSTISRLLLVLAIAAPCFGQANIGGGSGGGGGIGGVNAQTANYTAVAGDTGKLITMNGSNLTLTLPNPPPSTTWFIEVLDLAATNLTISRNGLLINGTASNMNVIQNGMDIIFTDGTNYFSAPGGGTFVSNVSGSTLNAQFNGGGFQAGNPGAPNVLNVANNGDLSNGFGGNIFTTGQVKSGGGFLSTGTNSVSGCSLSASVGGSSAGKFASGTSGTCTVTLTLPTATNGWTCDAHDLTTAADANNMVQTAFTTTSATISGTTVSGDVITWKCTGF